MSPVVSTKCSPTDSRVEAAQLFVYYGRVSDTADERIINAITGVQRLCHVSNVANGWWHDTDSGEPLKRNIGELLILQVSEIAEGMEGARKDLMDDKLPHRKMLEVELADAVVRILDLGEAMGFDIFGALLEKVAFNMNRPDHKPENRAKEGGKKF